MVYNGSTVKAAISKAVTGGGKQASRRDDDCRQIANDAINVQRDLERLMNEVERIESELRRNERESIEAGVDVAEAIVSVAVPMAGRARKALKLIVAVRRALQGARSVRILQELRDLIDILSDIREGIEGLVDLTRLIPEWGQLRNRLSSARIALSRAQQSATGLRDRYLRSRCYRHHMEPRPNQSTPRGSGDFTGV